MAAFMKHSLGQMIWATTQLKPSKTENYILLQMEKIYTHLVWLMFLSVPWGAVNNIHWCDGTRSGSLWRGNVPSTPLSFEVKESKVFQGRDYGNNSQIVQTPRSHSACIQYDMKRVICVCVCLVCPLICAEMQDNTDTKLLPSCMRLNVVQNNTSASPLISLLWDKYPNKYLDLHGPSRCDFIHVWQFVVILPS